MSKGTGELLLKGESVGTARYDIQSVVRGGKRSMMAGSMPAST